MKINISKDIDSFNKNNFWKGLSRREVFHGILCILICVIVVCKVEPALGSNAASYIGMALIVPVGLNGFYKKNGLYFWDYIKEYRKQNSGESTLTYGSGDQDMLYQKAKKEVQKENVEGGTGNEEDVISFGEQ